MLSQTMRVSVRLFSKMCIYFNLQEAFTELVSSDENMTASMLQILELIGSDPTLVIANIFVSRKLVYVFMLCHRSNSPLQFLL